MVHVPILGGSEQSHFPLQFNTGRVDRHSLACTLILHIANDGSGQSIGHASGFFWRKDRRVYLVTARHVLSGQNPFDDKPTSNMGFVPSRIRIFPAIEHSGGRGATRVAIEIELSHDPRNWLQDPHFDVLRTDIAAIDIPDLAGSAIICINDHPDFASNIYTNVGYDCVILGYPNPNFGGLITPIWRIGCLASEPDLPIDGKPIFLIDAMTGAGFSGAPVFRRHLGPLPTTDENGEMTVILDRVATLSLVGVYAGRIDSKNINNEVPFVFYANRIEFILNQ